MEVIISYIFEIEVRDKCYMGLLLVNMEKEGLRNVLERFFRVLKVVESVIDVFVLIKKLICKY